MAIKIQLFKHQQDAVNIAGAKTFFGLLFECGLGKTLAALAIIEKRKASFPKYKTLYVCPATLIENIIEEVAKYTDLTCLPLVGSKARRLVKLDLSADVYVINYEGARIIPDELIAKKFDCVVFDESQACKNHTAQQSKACYRIAMSIPHRLIMTGTPLHNGPLDAFGQMRLLNQDIFGLSYYRFRAHYAIMGGFLNKQVLKYINMEHFRQRIQKCCLIKTKAECLDLPPQLYEIVRIDLPDEQQHMYKQLKNEFLASMNGHIVTAPVVLTRLMRFSQITAGFYKDIKGEEVSYAKNPKQEWLIEWLKEHGHKTVVFVRFIKELKDLEYRLSQAGIKSVSVYGGVQNRIDLVNQFRDSPEHQVFIGQIDTAGQGINLQAASYCVFLSNNYSYGDREQAEGRIHRSGQPADKCTYIDVVARGTIDERVLAILKKKESLSEVLIKHAGDLV